MDNMHTSRTTHNTCTTSMQYMVYERMRTNMHTTSTLASTYYEYYIVCLLEQGIYDFVRVSSKNDAESERKNISRSRPGRTTASDTDREAPSSIPPSGSGRSRPPIRQAATSSPRIPCECVPRSGRLAPRSLGGGGAHPPRRRPARRRPAGAPPPGPFTAPPSSTTSAGAPST